MNKPFNAGIRPNCPRCNQAKPIRYGFVLGRQRWQCRTCQFQFTQLARLTNMQALKAQAVKLYEAGKSSNQIASLLGVSPTSILRWARMFSSPTGRVHQLKPRLLWPEPYRSLFRDAKKLSIPPETFSKKGFKVKVLY